MFKAEMEDVTPFKDSLQAISNLIAEGKFQVTDEGLNLKAADPAMVSLVDFTLLEGAFESFEAEDDVSLGLNLEKLYSIIRRAKSSDTLVMELEDDSKFTITMKNGSTRTFSLPLLNLDQETPETSQLEFDVRADFNSSTLSDGIGDVSVVGDSVTFSADGDAITIRAEGSNSDAEFRIEKGSDGLLELDADSNIKSMFSMDYLKKMLKAEKLSDTVKLQLGNDFPMRLDFEVPDTLRLGFILAPRIEE